MNPNLAFCIGGFVCGLAVWLVLSARTRFAEDDAKRLRKTLADRDNRLEIAFALIRNREQSLERCEKRVQELTPKHDEHGRFISKHPLDTVEMP